MKNYWYGISVAGIWRVSKLATWKSVDWQVF